MLEAMEPPMGPPEGRAPGVRVAEARLPQDRPPRVLLGKLGLDGHDRGIKLIARTLRDHGMEVIYLGMRLSPQDMARAALQEDADVVGVSLLSGAHMRLIPRLVEALREEGLSDVILLAGGTIGPHEAEKLRAMGVHSIFGVGTPLEAIVQFIQQATADRRQVAGDRAAAAPSAEVSDAASACGAPAAPAPAAGSATGGKHP